jgi:penicillin-binding protein 1A
MDTPVSFGSYTPHNYENDYKGAMTLAHAFEESRNVPAVKLAAHVGIHKVIDMAHRFGVTSNIPAYLPIALGAVEITLEEQVASYAVFPNDGLRVKPRMVRRVSNADGSTLWEDTPSVNEVIDQQTARTMMTLLRGVTQHGTGAAAAQLNHPLGGKTGTTSEYTDAWFLGFSPSVTCGVWVGYDTNQSLGEKETGARAALPIWMTWMRAAIAGKDDEQFLGDKKEDQLLRADAKAPGKPTPPSAAAAKSIVAKAPALTGKPIKPNAAKPNAIKPNAAAKVPAVAPVPAAKPVALPASAPPLAHPITQQAKGLVKVALPAQPAQSRIAPAVKPALGGPADSGKPKNPR